MFYFEVPSDNKLVDLVKQIKKGEMDIYLGLFLFSYQSISLFFHGLSSQIEYWNPEFKIQFVSFYNTKTIINKMFKQEGPFKFDAHFTFFF